VRDSVGGRAVRHCSESSTCVRTFGFTGDMAQFSVGVVRVDAGRDVFL